MHASPPPAHASATLPPPRIAEPSAVDTPSPPAPAQAACGTSASPSTHDPCAALRAAAASKGLTLHVYTGRRLPAALASEAVALAERNVGAFGGWDSRQRLADLQHPQTKVLALRLASISGGRADGTEVQTVPSSTRRASRSRPNASAAADSDNARLADAAAEPALVGFASFRFVVQETLRVVCACLHRHAPRPSCAELLIAPLPHILMPPAHATRTCDPSAHHAPRRPPIPLRAPDLFELHLAHHLRRQSLGSHLISAVRAHAVAAQRDGLLLTCHHANGPA
jgi:hypothetical protein